jgi:hypothetical protein
MEREAPRVLHGLEARPSPPVAGAAAPAQLAPFAGRYLLPSGEALQVELREGRLSIPSTAAALRLLGPWPMAEGDPVAALGDRASLVTGAFDAVDRGDYGPISARLPPDQRAAEDQAFWRAFWPRWESELGPYQGTDLVGTVEVKDRLDRVRPGLRTLAVARFERGSKLFGFVHADGGRFWTDTMSSRISREVVLAPRGDGGASRGEFHAWHPNTGRIIDVTFTGANADRSLRIGAEGSSVTARRQAP